MSSITNPTKLSSAYLTNSTGDSSSVVAPAPATALQAPITPHPLTCTQPNPSERNTSSPAYTTYHPYDGAITLPLPTGYIDASDLRQVPDHQALYLSPTTLTSVLIEINERLDEPDQDAVESHFADPVETEKGDRCTVADSRPMGMGAKSLRDLPSWTANGEITSRNHSPQDSPQRVLVLMVLVRIEQNATDLVVRIHMPVSELEQKGGDAYDKERTSTLDMLDQIVQELDVKDWGLFG